MADQDLTPEQITELQTKAAKVDELEKFKTENEPKLKELETLEKEKPNWQKARQTIDALKTIAKEKGVEVDDDGKIINTQKPVDMNEITSKAAETMRKEMIEARVDEFMDQYDTEEAKQVRHFFTKLTAGEEVTLKNVKSFVAQAEKAAGIDSGNSKVNDILNFSGGQGPRPADTTKLEDIQAKNLGANMGLGFATAKPAKK